MPQKGKRRVDHKILMALACGASAENAARQVGVSESTVFRRLNDSDFCRRLQELKADMLRRAAAALAAASGEAVRTLLELMKTPNPPPTRLGAARSVVEFSMKTREFTELEDRMAALEQQAETHKSY
jgi:hypothetical protein